MRLKFPIRLETEAPNDDAAELDDVVSGCCSGITLTGRAAGMLTLEEERCEEEERFWELGDA